MRTLDRYVIRSFLSSALLLFIAVMALRIVADLFLNMDEFLEQETDVADLLGRIGSYYGYQSLLYFSEMGGVIIVAAAAFTLARMNHTNELTAMLASGVSLYRVILPIVICAMLLGGLVILDRELLIPPNAYKLARTRDEAAEFARFPVRLMSDGNATVWYSSLYEPGRRTMHNPVLLIRDDDRKLIASAISRGQARPGRFNGLDGWKMTDTSLSRAGEEARSWQNAPDVDRIHTTVGPVRLLAEAKALAARHNVPVPPDDQIRRVWNLPPVRDDGYELTITAASAGSDTPQLRLDPYAPGDGRGGKLHRPLFTFATSSGKLLGIFYAESATWVPGAADESHWQLEGGAFFYPTDLTAEDLVLRQSSRWLDLMSTPELTKLLELDRIPDRRGAELAKHVRFADPINNLVMLLIGLPFIVSRERNIRAAAGLCLLMVGVYFAFFHLCRLLVFATPIPYQSGGSLPGQMANLAISLLSRLWCLEPVTGAFLPIVLFGTFAAVMLDAVKT